MSKQTAVEWLTPKILGLTIELSKRKISQRTCELEIMKLIEQAKAMEREQIEKAYKKGCMDEIDKRIESCVEESCKTDYNETYKGESNE